MGNMKENLLAKIKEIKIQHPRAADYLAKISRSDDCFALMFDANHDTCRSCLIKATYEGKEYEMKDLCAHFMQFALVKPEEAAPPAAPAADAIPEGRKVPSSEAPSAAPEKKEEKKEKAPKAPKEPKKGIADDVLSENEEKALKLVKKGVTSGTAIAKELDVWPSQAYGVLDKLIERGLVEKKKAEKGKGSAFFPK